MDTHVTFPCPKGLFEAFLLVHRGPKDTVETLLFLMIDHIFRNLPDTEEGRSVHQVLEELAGELHQFFEDVPEEAVIASKIRT